MIVLEDRIREVLRNYYGNFCTELEIEYEDTLVQSLLEENDFSRDKWVTYNQVILEYKDVMKDYIKVQELQYRLTDREDPDTVCMDVIRSSNTITPELQRLYEKIMNFKE